jgi:hypothetical protein
MNPRTLTAAAFAALILGSASQTHADPRPGAAAPSFDAEDLNGRAHSSRELAQRPTVVVVCTSADASSAANAWLQQAKNRAHGQVRVVTLVALRLPFFVSQGMVRGRARPQVNPGEWTNTWIDVHGHVQSALGISDGSATPYVFTVDAQGRVVASVHAPVNHPSASAIMSAIDQVGGALAASR